MRKPALGLADPWDARTLEWTTTSPPPHYNFEEIPVVHSLDDFWHRKYAEGGDGKLAPVVAGAANGAGHPDDEAGVGHGHGIHMPSPSYWPIVVALGLPVLFYGLVYDHLLLIIDGGLLLLAGLYGWAVEPSAEPEH